MARTLATLGALGLVVLTGLAHGYWTYRWDGGGGVSAARLARLPRTVGDWEGQDLELPADQVAGAGLSGYVLRRYENRITGQSVHLLLVSGRRGPISVHTPEVCYAGAGYRVEGAAAKQAVEPEGGRPGSFWAANFRKERSLRPTVRRVLWAWSAGGPWEAADNPRLSFPKARSLYKLYVVHDLSSAGPADKEKEDVSGEFLRRLLPELDAALFAPEGGHGA